LDKLVCNPHMLETAYVGLFELLMNLNLFIMNVIRVGLLLLCVFGCMDCGCKEMKMIDDEIS
jgi:hypothetical protein